MNHSAKKSTSLYRVIPKITRINVEETIYITPLGKRMAFLDDAEYTVKFVPMENYSQEFITNAEFDTVRLHPSGGALTLSYTFAEEQEWSIVISSDDERLKNKKPVVVNVYSLCDDLYELNPYRGDLHVHSIASDGREDPVVVAANYRKEGFDFFALTDHRFWEPSDELCRAYENIPLGMKIFRGEEVHLPTAWIHVVNFGSDYSVNSLYRENKDKIDAQMKKEAESLCVPSGVSALEYAYRRWITTEIRRAGGLAIIPHPAWITNNVYHMSFPALEHVFKTGYADAFELIGGQSAHENNMQTAFYNDMLAKGIRIPIVGSSDSHGTDPASYFGIGMTVVFARDMEKETLFDAIKNFSSVAIEKQYDDGDARVYGSFRLVKYTKFLLNNYFPHHDELCFEEGRLMREYALGNEEAGEALTALSDRVEKAMNHILRGR